MNQSEGGRRPARWWWPNAFLSSISNVILNDPQREPREFAEQRDWRPFHTPKNLAMALTGEAGELAELFQWLTPEESSAVMKRPEHAERVREEVADVFAHLLQIADVLDIDLVAALRSKMRRNEWKYPVERAKGRSDKYDRLSPRVRTRSSRALPSVEHGPALTSPMSVIT
jgi:dCTP diphosphatase